MPSLCRAAQYATLRCVPASVFRGIQTCLESGLVALGATTACSYPDNGLDRNAIGERYQLSLNTDAIDKIERKRGQRTVNKVRNNRDDAGITVRRLLHHCQPARQCELKLLSTGAGLGATRAADVLEYGTSNLLSYIDHGTSPVGCCKQPWRGEWRTRCSGEKPIHQLPLAPELAPADDLGPSYR